MVACGGEDHKQKGLNYSVKLLLYGEHGLWF